MGHQGLAAWGEAVAGLQAFGEAEVFEAADVRHPCRSRGHVTAWSARPERSDAAGRVSFSSKTPARPRPNVGPATRPIVRSTDAQAGLHRFHVTRRRRG